MNVCFDLLFVFCLFLGFCIEGCLDYLWGFWEERIFNVELIVFGLIFEVFFCVLSDMFFLFKLNFWVGNWFIFWDSFIKDWGGLVGKESFWLCEVGGRNLVVVLSYCLFKVGKFLWNVLFVNLYFFFFMLIIGLFIGNWGYSNCVFGLLVFL